MKYPIRFFYDRQRDLQCENTRIYTLNHNAWIYKTGKAFAEKSFFDYTKYCLQTQERVKSSGVKYSYVHEIKVVQSLLLNFRGNLNQILSSGLCPAQFYQLQLHRESTCHPILINIFCRVSLPTFHLHVDEESFNCFHSHGFVPFGHHGSFPFVPISYQVGWR